MFTQALLAVLLAGGSPGRGANPAAHLAAIRPAPAFRLTTQDGRAFDSVDLRGRVWVVSFVFTTCNGTCPATTHRMDNLARKLEAKGLLKGGRVRLVSITLDPAHDTPEVLRRYMRLYDADPAHWTFLTGAPTRVAKVIADWGMWARQTAGGQLDHPSRIFLVDPRGRVREIYSLEFFRPAWVAGDVEALLREAAGARR